MKLFHRKIRTIPSALCILTLLFIAIFSLGAQQVDLEELRKTSSNTINFINYEGPYARIDSQVQIREIGYISGASIASGTAFDGQLNRYFVIHSVTAPEGDALDADIFGLGVDVGVGHINNLRLIIQGYLEGAYSYSPQDAALLAEYITIYNAVFRGNWSYLSGRYKTPVVQQLTPEKAGLSIRFDEWPGQTLMLIPLALGIPGSLSALNTTALSSPEVIAQMRTLDDRGIETRMDMVDFKEREAEEAEQRAILQRLAIAEEEQRIAEERAALAALRDSQAATQTAAQGQAAQTQTGTTAGGQSAGSAVPGSTAATGAAGAAPGGGQSAGGAAPGSTTAGNASSSNTAGTAATGTGAAGAAPGTATAGSATPGTGTAGNAAATGNQGAAASTTAGTGAAAGSTTAGSAAAGGQQLAQATPERQADPREAALAQREAALARQREEAEEAERLAAQKAQEAQQERIGIAADQQRLIALPEDRDIDSARGILGVQLANSNAAFGYLVRLDPSSGRALRTSAIGTVNARTITQIDSRVFAVAGENRGGGAIRVIEMNSRTLEMTNQGGEDIHPQSLIWVQGRNLYAISISDGEHYLIQYDMNLVQRARSAIPVHPFGAPVFQDDLVSIQQADGSMALLNVGDLSPLRTAQEIANATPVAE